MIRPIVFAIGATVVAAPPPAAAWEQDGSPPPEGTRVRLTSCYSALSSTCSVAAGTLSSWRNDSVVMRPEGKGEPVGVPRAWVTRIEVSRGRQKSTGTGAVIGFVPGLIGLTIATVSPETFPSDPGTPCPRDCVMTASLGFSILGSAIGAFIGSAIKSERWESLPLPVPQPSP